MTIPIRKNTAQIITVGPFLDKTDGVTPELSLTVTGCHTTLVADTADGSAPTLVIDADATASGGDNDLVHITNDNAGYYSLELTATQTNRNGHGRLCINDDDVHCPVFHDLVFLDANVFDSLYGTDKLNVDMVEISGDATAADNLEDMFEETTAIGNLIDFVDGTGYAGGTIKLATDATLNATQGSYAPAKAGDLMGLADDAITSAKFDESTAFPVKSADTGSTALARTGADSDTLETLSDQIDGAALEATLTAIKGAGWSTETLAAIDALIDAVKAKTDLIPASPAAVGSAMTLTAAYDAAKTAAQASDIPTANITAILADTGEIQAELADGGRTDLLIDGIKAKTDNLPAAPADDSDIDSQLATIAGYLDTEVAAILADTNELQTDLVNGGRLDLLIDGIKAKTDLIPASPAAVGSAMTLTAAYDLAKTAAQTSDITTAHATTDGKIDAVDNYVDTEISTIIATLATIQGYVDDLESRLTATRAGYLDNLATAPPTASEIDTELSSSHGAGAWGAASTGSSTYTDTVKDTDESGLPVEGVDVYLYNNSGYSGNPVASDTTDVNGVFSIPVDPGTYYVRCIKSGYTFTDFSKVVT